MRRVMLSFLFVVMLPIMVFSADFPKFEAFIGWGQGFFNGDVEMAVEQDPLGLFSGYTLNEKGVNYKSDLETLQRLYVGVGTDYGVFLDVFSLRFKEADIKKYSGSFANVIGDGDDTEFYLSRLSLGVKYALLHKKSVMILLTGGYKSLQATISDDADIFTDGGDENVDLGFLGVKAIFKPAKKWMVQASYDFGLGKNSNTVHSLDANVSYGRVWFVRLGGTLELIDAEQGSMNIKGNMGMIYGGVGINLY